MVEVWRKLRIVFIIDRVKNFGGGGEGVYKKFHCKSYSTDTWKLAEKGEDRSILNYSKNYFRYFHKHFYALLSPFQFIRFRFAVNRSEPTRSYQKNHLLVVEKTERGRTIQGGTINAKGGVDLYTR